MGHPRLADSHSWTFKPRIVTSGRPPGLICHNNSLPEIVDPPSGRKNNSVKDGSVPSKDQVNMDEDSDSVVSAEDLASAEDDDDVSDREFKTMNSVILSLQVLAICI